MDSRKHLIVIKGVSQTESVHTCKKEPNGYYRVQYKGSYKNYCYSPDNLVWLSHPQIFDPKRYVLRDLNGHEPVFWPRKVTFLAFFKSHKCAFWYVESPDHSNGILFREKEVQVVDRIKDEDNPRKNVFKYLCRLADVDEVRHKETDIALLSKYYSNIKKIPDDRVVNAYLYPKLSLPSMFNLPSGDLIYPFGLNQSQREAVEAAFLNRLSIIQGPPGTGKTQTILNILANLLRQGKTALVVSNNNTATSNIKEKLQKYGLDFIVAFLGNHENVDKFLAEQESIQVPSMTNWNISSAEMIKLEQELNANYRHLDEIFSLTEKMVRARQELQALKTEQKNFLKLLPFQEITIEPRPWVKTEDFPEYLLDFWTQKATRFTQPSEGSWLQRFIFKLHCSLKMRADRPIYELRATEFIRVLQYNFYRTKINLLTDQLKSYEQALGGLDPNKTHRAIEKISVKLLKKSLYDFYVNKTRTVFKDLWKDDEKFQKLYPIVLSTTFSSRNCLGGKVVFDYVIMDEASQVPIVTGALAMCCAKNAVIVGDREQLINVVTNEQRKKLSAIFAMYDLDPGYDASQNSFLDSLLRVLPTAKRTLLREHYRCDPRIINFCNKKFYGGDLLIMTEKNSSIKEAVFAVRTVEGNHRRNHMNQREIDVLFKEVLPKLYRTDDLAVVTPYNDQAKALDMLVLGSFDVSTVHKYQGREKECVVLSCVDNKVNDFNDDRHLINVAVSRAKKQFGLIITGNELKPNSHLADLLAYIEYENGEITQSKVQSIFDYLYKQYGEARRRYLTKSCRVSEYDSENLTYALLKEVIKTREGFQFLDIFCHYPLSGLLRDTDLLNNDEATYALSPLTHVDFLIANKVSHKPVLVVETDGYRFHEKGSKQAERDRKKDLILNKYGIPILRLSTIGSNERESVINRLNEILS